MRSMSSPCEILRESSEHWMSNEAEEENITENLLIRYVRDLRIERVLRINRDVRMHRS